MAEVHIPLHGIMQKIQQTAIKTGQAVALMAVSKQQSAGVVRLLVAQGQRLFGENYVQEAIAKQAQLIDISGEIEWALIGPLQRNKTTLAAQHFDWVLSVDRLLIAQRLSTAREQLQLSALNICIQVNIDDEPTKSGCTPDEVMSLVERVIPLSNLKLRGLMVVPTPDSIDAFERSAQLFQSVAQQFPKLASWDTLSMGMSADFEAAIAAGSTMVRIGTALFGQRNSSE